MTVAQLTPKAQETFGAVVNFLNPIFNPVRATSVLVPRLGFPQSLGIVVGATGIEPVTPAMSTQVRQQFLAVFSRSSATPVLLCAL